jgi:hypothetical protein
MGPQLRGLIERYTDGKNGVPMSNEKIPLSSQYLYHFTTKSEYLISILKNGFEHRPMHEDLPLTSYNQTVWAIPGIIRHQFTFHGVCFCDIPEHSIEDHSNQYGKYGICLKKNWGFENGITPIRYIHHSTPDFANDTFHSIKDTLSELPTYGGSFTRMIMGMLSQTEGLKAPSQEEILSWPENVRRYLAQIDVELSPILSHTVRYLGLARSYRGDWKDRVTGKSGTRVFYDEMEWRSLKVNKDQGNLLFTNEDIVAIITPSIEEKTEIVAAMAASSGISSEKVLTLEEYLKPK